MNTRARVQEAYDAWSDAYDTQQNPTRDLNAEVLREQALPLCEAAVLEIGCGTGANTAWLAERARQVVALDFSDGMLQQARRRPGARRVQFRRADITEPWPVDDAAFHLVVANLVLEHVEALPSIFREARRVLRPGGTFYVGELHPYKQIQGSQARFQDVASGREVQVPAFAHSVSDFVNAGLDAGLTLEHLGEWKQEADAVPRLLTLRFSR